MSKMSVIERPDRRVLGLWEVVEGSIRALFGGSCLDLPGWGRLSRTTPKIPALATEAAFNCLLSLRGSS